MGRYFRQVFLGEGLAVRSAAAAERSHARQRKSHISSRSVVLAQASGPTSLPRSFPVFLPPQRVRCSSKGL
jgi:hypothetical protein